MPNNHLINALYLIARGEFEKAIGLWRLYMRFRQHCEKLCEGLEPSKEMCGNCLSCNLRIAAEDLDDDLAGTSTAYFMCSKELDIWLDPKDSPKAA